MNVVTVLCSFIIMLCLGVLFLWLPHEKFLRWNYIEKPWKESIKASDWPSCDYWKKVSETYPLLNLSVVFNPIAWVRYWNWKPSQSIRGG